MSAVEDVSLSETQTTPLNDSAVENGTEQQEEYETVQLEACASGAESAELPVERSEEAPNETWTTYELTQPDSEEPTAAPQSPAVSEITPAENEEKPEFPKTEAPIQISVSNPKRAEEVSKLGIRSSFTSYLVQSETTLADYPFTSRSVWRRYKDFDMLHRLLRENHRGYIVPPLPSKNFFESKRGKDTFIKERQTELNKFLNQAAMHPNLYNTEEMKVFLGSPGELTASREWYSLIESSKQLTETAEDAVVDLDNPVGNMKRDVASMFKRVSSTIKREVVHPSYPVSETERSLQDMVPKIKQLELQLGGVVEKSQSFLKLFGEIGSELGLLGRIWLTISRFEEGSVEAFGQYSETGRSLIDGLTALHKAGYAAIRVQQITSKSEVLLQARLSVLTDHFNTLPSVLLCLQDRTIVLRHLYNAQSHLEASRRALDALTRDSNKVRDLLGWYGVGGCSQKLGGTAGFSNKSALLSQEIRTYVDEVSKRTEMYDVVTQRNLAELERQNGRRSEDLLDLALSTAKMQQEYHETVSLVWVNLAEEISRLVPNDTQSQ